MPRFWARRSRSSSLEIISPTQNVSAKRPCYHLRIDCALGENAQDKRRLYLANVDFSVKSEEIHKLFVVRNVLGCVHSLTRAMGRLHVCVITCAYIYMMQTCGDVRDVHIIQNIQSKPTGVAFVEFANEEQAAKALGKFRFTRELGNREV